MSKKDKTPPASKDAGQGKDKKKFPTKLGAIAIIALIAFAMMAGSVSAYEFGSLKGYSMGTQTNYMTFSQKDPITWEPINNGVRGEMVYSPTVPNQFNFRGYHLKPKTQYTLVRATEDWKMTSQYTYISNAYGDIDYAGYDPYFKGTGNRVWLIETKDTNLGAMSFVAPWKTYNVYFTNYQPQNYLFEDMQLVRWK